MRVCGAIEMIFHILAYSYGKYKPCFCLLFRHVLYTVSIDSRMSAKKIFSNTLAQIGSKVMTAVISIFLIKILTWYLDLAGYGLYSKIYNYLSIFAVIADLGLYTITVREISENRENPKFVEKISSNVLTLRTLMGGVIIILAVTLAYFLDGYDSPLALLGVGIAGFFTLLWLMNSSIMSVLQAHLKTEFSFIANISGKLTTFFLIFTISQSGIPIETGFLLIFLAWFVGNSVMTLCTWWYARRITRIHFWWDPVYIRHILWISLPYWLALFLNVIFFKVDVILLSLLEPQDIADRSIALYSVPMKIVEVGMMYGTVFLGSLLPVLTLAFRENHLDRVRDYIEKSALILLYFGLGASIFLIAFSREIIILVANHDYVSRWGLTSVDAMQIVASIFFFYFLSSLFTYVLIASNRQKIMLAINAGVAAVNIVWNIYLIPHFSFVGSAYMTLISQILLLILTWYVTRGSIRLQRIFLPVLTFVITLLIAWWITRLFLPLAWESIFQRLGIWLVIFGFLYIWVGGLWLRKIKDEGWRKRDENRKSRDHWYEI